MRGVHLIIKGKVQGVFFRVSAKEIADQLKITGTVKNTAEGDVEITACGEPETIEKFIDWCRKGPARARVDEVIINDTFRQSFVSFEIIK